MRGMRVFQEGDKWIAVCEECGFRGEKDNQKSAEMLLVRHAALCPARKKEREKAKRERPYYGSYLAPPFEYTPYWIHRIYVLERRIERIERLFEDLKRTIDWYFRTL